MNWMIITKKEKKGKDIMKNKKIKKMKKLIIN